MAWLVNGMVAVWVIGSGIAVAIVSLYHSLLVDRYLLLVVPGAALMAAQGAAPEPTREPCRCRALFGGLAPRGHRRRKRRPLPHGQLASSRRIRRGQVSSDDGAIFAPIVKVVAFEFYVLKHHDEWPVSVVPPGQWGATRVVFGEVDKPSAVARSATTIAKLPRIWLIIGRGLGGGPERDYLRVARAVLDDRSRTGSWSFGEVDVELYE